ncbi:unnamed protein product [Adineta ricciae]|nr:unnamed protein product [Adineta ricciae]
MADFMDTSPSPGDQSSSENNSTMQTIPNDPSAWTLSDVIVWLRSCNLEQCVSAFEANEVDGSTLMSEDFDAAMIKELIPTLKHRVTFISARKNLRVKSVVKPTGQNLLTAHNNGDAKQFEEATEVMSTSCVPKFNQDRNYHLVRTDTKACCQWENSGKEIVRLDAESMLQPRHTTHSLSVSNQLSTETLNLLTKLFHYIHAVPTSNELDIDFNSIIDEPLNSTIVLKCISNHQSLKSYIVDSLKRYHNLSDVIQVLSSVIDLPAVDKTYSTFADIIEKITKSLLLVCTIESMSYESQRFFGNMIKKNDLPIPLTYYTYQQNEVRFKINFNPLVETFCYSNEKILLCLGSPTAVGLGKTSILPYLFENIKSESLNTEGNAELRYGCVDTMFTTLKKNDPYVVFDVHGTMNTMNEDLITSLQQYCAIQIIFLTADDLQNGDFIRKIMNYSTEIRNKPTIFITFDHHYGEKNTSSCGKECPQIFSDEKWSNAIWKTAPILNQISGGSRLNNERRIQRLRQNLLNAFDSLQTLISRQPICKSIFAIEAYLLAVKSNSNTSPPPLIQFDIEDTLKTLFDGLSDQTDNLQRVTPVTYLQNEKMKCEKELAQLWNDSPGDLPAKLEQIKKQYEEIDRIPEYSAFFIDLLIRRTYVELLITEKYLEQWRMKYEPTLSTQLTRAKNDAMTWTSRMKSFEEEYQQHMKNENQPEVENAANQMQAIRGECKASQDLLNKIEKQLFNIDLTIGLFCDEIYALYELLPKLFEMNNSADLLAKKLSQLMYKGFSFHILRGRPLRCNSKLIQTCLKYLHESNNESPLVLTVIGEQSSAKSSLLNATFGCNFRVSAGRCTIGMYMSVVRWRSRTIVIFDTEGLMSLEESGSIFDNQMVSMAMLSSHLVLINHKGEFSSNLEHLIGMSFYAKLQIRSPLRPKLLFVLRDQSDTGATEIFFQQLAKFKENLYNDSKFLKSSIDDELEINEQHVILLTNAFSNDFHPILGVEQTWRNNLFPRKINALRTMVFNTLTESITETYVDIPQLYQKVASNWDAIDKLGPHLLSCKTLYELSIMNELRDFAREIIEESITAINNEGRQHIDRILADINHENFGNFKEDNLMNLFSSAIQATHKKILDKAIADYQSKTERSCFPLEIRYKVEKTIEQPILNMQSMLKEDFDERYRKAYRDARVSSAQHRLIETVQQEFDRNTKLGVDQLQVQVETVYKNQLEICRQTLRRDVETEDQIISKILKFYNSALQSKTANTSKQSIYNLLHPLNASQFRESCHHFINLWKQVTNYGASQEANISLWQHIMKFVENRFLGDRNDDLLRSFHNRLQHWFQDDRAFHKDKKLLIQIVENLLPQLQDDVAKLMNEHFSSSSLNPRIIGFVFTYIENVFNHDCIRSNQNRIALHSFLSDVAIIALEVLVEESLKSEKRRHEKDMENCEKEMIEWKERISMQIQHMHNSHEQGQNMAEIVSEEIFKEVGRILLDQILHEMTEDIAKSQFINHEAVQKQAYEESFGLGNGEKILKYVLNVNRYFRELSLREINTKVEAILHMHTMNAEGIILKVIHKANDIAQNSTLTNTQLIANDIERAVCDMDISSLNLDKKFAIVGVMSVTIEDLPNFQQGFKNILNSINSIQEKVISLTKDVKMKAYAGCKERISRRLGCQSRCPGCGSKCSRPEPHEEEMYEPWFVCQCAPNNCTCERPEPKLLKKHATSHHIAQAFFGRKYYKIHTPVLELCYQRWKSGGMFVGDIEIAPLQKFYDQYHPDWCDNLRHLSTEGTACNESIPPVEQRRAWMIVRHVLVPHYARYGMVEEENYNKKFYPSNVDSLLPDFKPNWNDTTEDPVADDYA